MKTIHIARITKESHPALAAHKGLDEFYMTADGTYHADLETLKQEITRRMVQRRYATPRFKVTA